VLLGGAVEGPYVKSKLEAIIAQKLRNAIEGAKSGEGAVVLLREFKGVGKSAAAAAAVHTLLQSGDVAVVDVAADFVKKYVPWKGSIEESIRNYVRENAEILLFLFLLS